ncbi:MAG: serine hydrolase [Bacteroidales bacterium]|nr:serine hydrolase [Bacteroidales bacterium]
MNKIYLINLLIISVIIGGCSAPSDIQLKDLLDRYIADKDATIGIAVIMANDTVIVNGEMPFPMMSVYKFPIAMAVAEKCRNNGMDFSQSCEVNPSDMHNDTYSPMMEKYAMESPFTITLNELLKYSLQLSDNNASDILLKWLGGAEVADRYIHSLDIENISIRYTEAELHMNPGYSYLNSSTPLAMASLLDRFNKEFDDSLSISLKQIMASCSTGSDRLAKPFLSEECTIIHKTGTGFLLPSGRLMALNDVGYIHCAGNMPYSIAVFICDAAYTTEESATIIADISEIVRQKIAPTYMERRDLNLGR